MSQVWVAHSDLLRWTRRNLPRWPRWKGLGQRITIVGWHLTPARGRLALFLAKWASLALLAYILVHCWRFQNIPRWLHDGLTVTASKLGYILTVDRLDWIYACLWLAALLLLRVWRALLYAIFAASLCCRTAVSFTVGEVRVHRLGRRPRVIRRDAGVSVSFLATSHPRLQRLEQTAQRRRNERLAALYQASRIVFVQVHKVALPVAGFVTVDAAQQFSAVCNEALDHPLQKAGSMTAFGEAERNQSDV